MIKFFAAIAMIAANVSAPVVAAPDRVQTIIADNSAECGIYRLAVHKREDNIATANREALRLERQGVKTRVIIIEPGQYRGSIDNGQTAPLAVFNAC